MSYIFRREDNGELVHLDFEEMMQAKDGFLELSIDGKPCLLRRCVHLELDRDGREKRKQAELGLDKPIESDVMGFSVEALGQWEDFRKTHGFRNVEYVQDKDVPTFYKPRFTNWSEWDRYRKEVGKTDNNSKNGSGAAISPAQLEKAKEILLRRIDTQKEIDAN